MSMASLWTDDERRGLHLLNMVWKPACNLTESQIADLWRDLYPNTKIEEGSRDWAVKLRDEHAGRHKDGRGKAWRSIDRPYMSKDGSRLENSPYTADEIATFQAIQQRLLAIAPRFGVTWTPPYTASAILGGPFTPLTQQEVDTRRQTRNLKNTYQRAPHRRPTALAKHAVAEQADVIATKKKPERQNLSGRCDSDFMESRNEIESFEQQSVIKKRGHQQLKDDVTTVRSKRARAEKAPESSRKIITTATRQKGTRARKSTTLEATVQEGFEATFTSITLPGTSLGDVGQTKLAPIDGQQDEGVRPSTSKLISQRREHEDSGAEDVVSPPVKRSRQDSVLHTRTRNGNLDRRPPYSLRSGAVLEHQPEEAHQAPVPSTSVGREDIPTVFPAMDVNHALTNPPDLPSDDPYGLFFGLGIANIDTDPHGGISNQPTLIMDEIMSQHLDGMQRVLDQASQADHRPEIQYTTVPVTSNVYGLHELGMHQLRCNSTAYEDWAGHSWSPTSNGLCGMVYLHAAELRGSGLPDDACRAKLVPAQVRRAAGITDHEYHSFVGPKLHSVAKRVIGQERSDYRWATCKTADEKCNMCEKLDMLKQHMLVTAQIRRKVAELPEDFRLADIHQRICVAFALEGLPWTYR